MEGEIITMQELFTFRQTGIANDGTVLGKLTSTGIRPEFFEAFQAHGINIDPTIFATHRSAAE
jgi:pilus assembly protein CpaF